LDIFVGWEEVKNIMNNDTMVEFTPGNPIPGFRSKFLGLIVLNVVGDTLAFLYDHSDMEKLYICAITLAVLTVIVFLSVKTARKLTIFKNTGQLQFDYDNFFGQSKNVTVDIKSASYKYKWESPRNSPGGMRLTIYSSYWHQVSFRASGFSEDQLDAIDKVITEIREK
jgi:hypothetical protein